MPPVLPNPARLPLGTLIGPWRVLERLGLGAYGAVYRAIGAQEPSSPVALKLARHPGDGRFARERELLCRLHHPNVPRLVDSGEWQQAGFCFPYVVMEWVDGVSLYEWARVYRPSSRQVLQVLAGLARALEATHSAGGVHRDCKGDNILIREADGRPFLTDFGSGHFLGAAPLTEPPFPPGTEYYRAPEAWRYVSLAQREPVVPYAPGAADDVFALGVSAYRLVTDEYPVLPEAAFRAACGDEAAPPAARARNPRCVEELSGLTARMLSASPEARGSARELAEALEQAAREAGPEADEPLFEREESEPAPTRCEPPRVTPRGRARAVSLRRVAGGLGAALALGAAWLLSVQRGVEVEEGQAARPEEMRDGGTVAVGDEALTAPVPPSQPPFSRSPLAVDLPPRPFPGQRRPDASGRCPGKKHFPIHGGCWIKLHLDLKDCEGERYYIYKGGCYVPSFPPARPPTSSPVERSGDTAE